MAILLADRLIARAEKGERLNVKDRRHAVAYLLATQPALSNVAMGEMFQVSERMIRLDVINLREEKAKLIKEDDIGLVIADIALNFERQIRDLETSKAECVAKKGLGTRTYLEHCKLIFGLELQKVTALQNLGYYPKNIGNMTVQTFAYKATVSVMEGGTPPPSVLEERSDDDGVLDAEFSDVETKLIEAPEGSSHYVQNESAGAGVSN